MILVLVLATVFINQEACTSQEISIAQGVIRGVSDDGFDSYLGIPYANITAAKGQFKRAGLAPTWTTVREPHTTSCTASSIEDCLTLDVYVPHGADSSIPVFVWVKTGSHYNPGRLVDRGIIVVIVNHRVGPLGFMCLGHDKIPGNAGAKDVVLALRWIRDNIVAFRGNPDKITLGGQSFGAAVVEALMLSPMAEGLFQGAIMQSGSVFSPWAFNYDAKERTMLLAESFSDNIDEDEVSSVLINTDVEELLEAVDKLHVPYFPFGLCVENAFKGEERLIFDAPVNSKIRNTKVPVMIGFNSNEAYVFVSSIKNNGVVRKLKNDISFLLPEELKLSNDDSVKQVVKKIKELYFNGNRTMAAVLAFHRDAYFINHVYKSAIAQAQSGVPVYLYQFSHTSSVGVDPEPGVKKTGAAHSDELAYLFVDKARTYDGEDAVVQDKLVTLWTDFVKFLNPTPKSSVLPRWELLRQYDPRLYNIGTEPVMQEFPHKRHIQLWHEIYQKYYYDRN